MSESTCKFCGAARDGRDRDFDHGSGTVTRFECESSQLNSLGGDKTWYESEVCKDGVLARFRTMFPTIMPDDQREITAEICEALGMQDLGFDGSNIRRWFQIDGGILSVSIRGDKTSGVYGDVPHRWCKTAGQLACLIAARRNVEAKSG